MSALKTGLAVAIAAIFFAACSGAPDSTNQNQNTPASAPPGETAVSTAANANQAASETGKPAATATDGTSLYKAQKCVGCHGPDGKGMMKDARDFTDPAWQKARTDDAIIAQIENGAPPKMPAYKDKLNDAEIKALVAHIRSFAK